MNVPTAFVLLVLAVTSNDAKPREDKTKCPEVKAVKNFDLKAILGSWYVVEYYANTEEVLVFACMDAHFKEDQYFVKNEDSVSWVPGVTMNFTYKYAGQPIGETLYGNITWKIDLDSPAHWTHAEDTYDGVYNTYVLDTEYKTWALILHCAEKREQTRYFTAFILGRESTLPINVKSYLKDKLRKYEVDPRYVFSMPHDNCDTTSSMPRRNYDTPVIVDRESISLAQEVDAYNIDPNY